MKKLILFSFLISGLLSGQTFDVGKKINVVQQHETKTNFGTITFKPSLYFWKVNIENTTSENVIIDWDKTTFVIQGKSSGVVFNDTIKMLINQPKGKEVIAPNSTLTKEIYPKEKAEYMFPLFSKKDVEKGRITDIVINLNFEPDRNISTVFKIEINK